MGVWDQPQLCKGSGVSVMHSHSSRAWCAWDKLDSPQAANTVAGAPEMILTDPSKKDIQPLQSIP